MTAHSPLVVQAAGDADAKLVVLRYDETGDHVLIDDDVQRVRGRRVDHLLTSELFGLGGPHSPEINRLYARRSELIMLGSLDEAQQRELDAIDSQLDTLPARDTAEQRRTWDVLQGIARTIEPKGGK